MVDALAHRGPDDRGTLLDRNVGIGMRRLSIIDTAGGRQPIANEDGALSVVYNGELYNHPELRRQLQSAGHAFRTAADTEVLVHGFEQWGLDGLLQRLDGIYAFCLYDRRERIAYLARDPMGVKPLYFTHRNGRFAFASELKGLIRSGLLSATVDEISLWSYLRYQFSAGNRTLLAGVEELPAGHWLRWRAGAVEVRRYWDYPDAAACRQRFADRREATEQLRELLERVVKGQMVSDVPVGCFLSGGLDSTILACLMARHSQGPLRTYSIGFPGDAEHDETDYAESVAKAIGAQHETIAFDERSVLELIEGDFA
jgi:asparagine synthase (glutamine-hydrolysing)